MVPGGMCRNAQRISRKNVRAFAVLHGHADFQTHRLQDVALLAVRVVQQRDPCRPVRVVFDGRYLRRDAGLVAPEINAAIALARARRHGARK